MEFFFSWLLFAFLVRYEARSSGESEKGQKCWRFEKKCETSHLRDGENEYIKEG